VTPESFPVIIIRHVTSFHLTSGITVALRKAPRTWSWSKCISNIQFRYGWSLWPR